jgi:carbamoyltransferase
MFNVIGISAHFHDSACCLLQDGIPVAAAQEERFTRLKHDKSLPVHAFKWCLQHADLTIADVDCVAYYEDPRIKLERQLWQEWPPTRPRCLQLWERARAPLDGIRDVLGYEGDLDVCTHHQSHAASTFLLSGFEEAAILTVDGVGEWATTAYGRGRRGDIELFDEVRFPDSLGLLYSTLTGYLGFAVNDGEHKVMGLAPYGRPSFVEQIGDLVSSGEGGQFRLNAACFDFTREDRMYSDVLPDKLGVAPRLPNDPILPVHHDLARSLQAVLEDLLLQKVRYLHERVPVEDLCMAGGVALNCVANGRILREGPFRRLFVQPASGDAGGALGAALLAHARRRGDGRVRGRLPHVYLGPSYAADAVADLLETLGISGVDYRGREADLISATADLLAAGKIIAWFQGRMEFGPRALGARSILGDPRDPTLRDRVNALIKQREGFRPFAPAVSAAAAADYFDLDHPSPYMLETCQVVSTIPLPAVTHVDGSARVQTVEPASHPRFAALLEAFGAQTGCPILLNTSFNLSDEPIVTTPADALVSFARSELDALVVEDFIVHRASLTDSVIVSCRERAGTKARPIEDRTYTF